MKVIRGKAYWVNLRTPNKMSGKLQIDIGNLDADTVKQLKKDGVNVRNKGDEREDFVTVKGGKDYPPRIVDSKKNPLPEGVMIGNGSTVKMPYEVYETTFNGNKFINPSLKTIMVIDLVQFKGGDDGLEEEEGGFTIDTDLDVLDDEPEPEPEEAVESPI